jgi:hypothetical protein
LYGLNRMGLFLSSHFLRLFGFSVPAWQRRGTSVRPLIAYGLSRARSRAVARLR